MKEVRSFKGRLARWLGLPIGALCLWLALRRIELADLERALSQARPGWLLLGSACFVVSGMFLGLRWQVLVRASGSQVAARTAYASLMIGQMVNNLLPGRLGELIRATVLARRVQAPVTAILATVVLDRMADIAATLLIGTMAVLTLPLPAWATSGGYLALGTLFGLGVVLTLGVWQTERAVDWAHRLESRLPHILRRLHPGRQVAGFLTGLGALRSGDVLLRVLLLSLTAWGTVLLGWRSMGRALGFHLSAPGLFFLLAAINLGVAIPSSPGYIGTFQLIVVLALGYLGVGRTTALAAGIAAHVAWLVPSTLIGLLSLWWMGLSLQTLHRVDTAWSPETIDPYNLRSGR